MPLGGDLRLGQTLLQELVRPARVTRAEDAPHEDLGRLVGAPDERTARHVREPEPLGLAREPGEGVGVDVAIDRGVLRRRPKVLPERDEVHARRAQIGERLDHLVVRLADADHDARLRDPRGVPLLHAAEDGERAVVAAAGVADGALQATHDLDVVGPHVGPGVDRRVDVVEVPAEVAEQRLDQDVGPELLQADDGSRDVRRAPVEEVVAIDHREDDVLKPQLGDGPRHVLGLAPVDRAARVARGHGAEAAAAGADVAEEHQRGGPLGPALADVGAARLLADRVEVERAEGLLEVRVGLAAGGAHLEPGGLGGEARGRGGRRWSRERT